MCALPRASIETADVAEVLVVVRTMLDSKTAALHASATGHTMPAVFSQSRAERRNRPRVRAF
jgi:hypothetical protein